MKWWLALALSASAAAHDLEVTSRRSGSAIIVRAAYAGTEPCAYAQVLVYSPTEAKTEHQNGRTDAQGLFAFVPDRPGSWRIIIDDELGHRKELAIVVGSVEAISFGGAALPFWQKALTGVSLIAGLSGVLYGWKARRAR